jgi:WD40 repeat protein
MNPSDAPAQEEEFALLLARYGEALTAGRDADPTTDPALSGPMRQRLQRALAGLRRLIQSRQRFEEQPTIDARGLGESPARPPADPDLYYGTIGQQVGRFRVVRELGRGGGGIVFLAIDPLLGRETALKVPKLEVLLTPEMRRRFLREARMAATLNHPNLASVYESGDAGGVCYIVSAYCPGGDLARWLRQHPGPIPPRVAAALVADLAGAVQHMHEHGIWHRDIKPSNILLDPSARAEGGFTPRLTDFGLAKLREGEGDATRNGAVLGTPPYMAPEQIEGRLHDIGPATDVYGLGAVLYELLTRRPPFQGTTDRETLRRAAGVEPIPPRRLRADLPRDLETICLKCLCKEPSGRYLRADELADDLRRFLDGRPIQARPIGLGGRAVKWLRRRPREAGLAALTVLAVLALLLVNLWHTGRARERSSELKAVSTRQREQFERAEQLERLAREQFNLLCLRSAQQAWEDGEAEVARELLQRYQRPDSVENDPCGFAWRHLWHLCDSHLWPDRARRRNIVVRESHPPEAWTVAYAPDGSLLASAGQDSTVQIREPATGRVLATLRGHRSLVGCVAFGPDGTLLASGDFDGTIRLWNARLGESLATLEGHTQFVRALAFSPDGRVLASGGRDHQVKLWDVAARRPTFTLAGHDDDVRALAFAPEGQRLASASEDATIKLWDSATGELRSTLHDAHEIWSLVFAPQGDLLASGNKAGRVVLWGVGSGQPRITLRGHSLGVRALAFTPDGRTLASGGENNTIKLWHIPTGEEVITLKGHGGPVNDLAFAPDGHALASAGHEGAVILWHAPRECELRVKPALSPSGSRCGSPARRRVPRSRRENGLPDEGWGNYEETRLLA